MPSITSVKSILVPIWLMAMTLSHAPSMNTTVVTTMDALFTSWIRQSWVKQEKTYRNKGILSEKMWLTKEPTLLKAVMENTLFGFLEVDIHVPDSLLSYFEEMPPLFCNTDVNYNDIGPFMQQYVKDQGLLQKPRWLLISGMKAKKILLSSPYLRWLLQKGLVVTKIYQVIEYAQKRCFSQFVQDVSNARRADDINEDKKNWLLKLWNLLGTRGMGLW